MLGLARLVGCGATQERVLRLILYAGRGLALMRIPRDSAFGTSEIRTEAMAGRAGAVSGLDRFLGRVRIWRSS